MSIFIVKTIYMMILKVAYYLQIVHLKEWQLIPSESTTPWIDNERAWQWPYTICCFALPLLIAVILTYGYERPLTWLLIHRRTNHPADKEAAHHDDQ